MDIFCVTCGEPWDHDTLHEVAEEAGSSYAKVSAEFRKIGCKAFEAAFGPQRGCVKDESGRTETIAAVYDVLGDDMDAAASMLDDAKNIGLL